MFPFTGAKLRKISGNRSYFPEYFRFNCVKYCIKTKEGDRNIVCWFSDKEISFNYKGDDERKYFYAADSKTNIRLEEEKKECFDSLVNLEKKYPAVTAMIATDIPLLDTVTNYCSPSKRKENSVKVYKLKRKVSNKK